MIFAPVPNIGITISALERDQHFHAEDSLRDNSFRALWDLLVDGSLCDWEIDQVQ